MKNKTTELVVKLFVGFLIFAFGLALAYFSADVIGKSPNELTYGLTLFGFSMVYIASGVAVSGIFPISLGLLFAADILLLNLLSDSFKGFQPPLKALIIALALAALYAIAVVQLKDRQQSTSQGQLPVG